MAARAQQLPGGGARGQLVYAVEGFMPARFLLAPVGAPLPAGVPSVVAEVVAPGGSGSRGTGLVARAAGGAGVVLSLFLDGASDAGQGVPSGVASSLSLDSASDAGVLGVLSFLSIDTTGAAAAGGPAARGGARRAGLLFLYDDASSGFARAAGGRGGRLVVAATTGSEADAGVESAASTATADKEGTFVFEDFITTQALEALAVVDGLLLPPTAEVEVSARLCDVKGALESAVVLPGSSGDKRSMAVKIMTAWYRVAQLTHAAYNLPGLPEDEEAFVAVCLAPPSLIPPVIINQSVPLVVAPLNVPASDAHLVNSVLVAVAVCQATARAARTGYGVADSDN